MAQNKGKIFEQDFQKSIPETCWIYRLRDNAASFGNNANTRFASSNICDYIAYDDLSKTLFLWELKSIQGISIPLTMVRENQIVSLLEASKHNLIAGLVCNFRNEKNDTFFIEINNFNNMMKTIGKKSFNIADLQKNNAVRILSQKKRTRYKYDIDKLVSETHL